MKIQSFATKMLLVCCLIFLSNPAFALDIPRDCRDLEFLQHKWETQYFTELKFNAYLQTIPPIKCDTLAYKFVKAIWVIENIQTSSEFGNIYQQLKDNVKEFRIIPGQLFSSCGNADPQKGKISLYLCAFSETQKKDSYVWSQDTYIRNLFKLISIIVHELRHLQMPEFSHVDCPNGDLKACDHEFSDNVALATPYAFEVLYLSDVLTHNPFNSNDRRRIESYIRSITRHGFLRPVSY